MRTQKLHEECESVLPLISQDCALQLTGIVDSSPDWAKPWASLQELFPDSGGFAVVWLQMPHFRQRYGIHERCF
jgi:hypothetical protein